jgi:F0F1-type ATP synthase membrane subunit b/b'
MSETRTWTVTAAENGVVTVTSDDDEGLEEQWSDAVDTIGKLICEREDMKRTHATALATVQALRDDALQERDAVTRELEEAKRLNLSLALSKDVTFVMPQMQPSEEASFLREMVRTLRTDYARLEMNHRDLYARSQQQLATARADVLREVREKVENLDRFDWMYDTISRDKDGDYLDRDAVLALLGGDA